MSTFKNLMLSKFHIEGRAQHTTVQERKSFWQKCPERKSTIVFSDHYLVVTRFSESWHVHLTAESHVIWPTPRKFVCTDFNVQAFECPHIMLNFVSFCFICIVPVITDISHKPRQKMCFDEIFSCAELSPQF